MNEPNKECLKVSDLTMGVACVLLQKHEPTHISTVMKMYWREGIDDPDKMRGMAIAEAMDADHGMGVMDVLVEIIHIPKPTDALNGSTQASFESFEDNLRQPDSSSKDYRTFPITYGSDLLIGQLNIRTNIAEQIAQVAYKNRHLSSPAFVFIPKILVIGDKATMVSLNLQYESAKKVEE